ncbi:MAG: hypothetical protein JWR80_7858 [Bradyrhizobium sp.]|nr:hypothetical protein [Bradyrhizobium sp.]
MLSKGAFHIGGQGSSVRARQTGESVAQILLQPDIDAGVPGRQCCRFTLGHRSCSVWDCRTSDSTMERIRFAAMCRLPSDLCLSNASFASASEVHFSGIPRRRGPSASRFVCRRGPPSAAAAKASGLPRSSELELRRGAFGLLGSLAKGDKSHVAGDRMDESDPVNLLSAAPLSCVCRNLRFRPSGPLTPFDPILWNQILGRPLAILVCQLASLLLIQKIRLPLIKKPFIMALWPAQRPTHTHIKTRCRHTKSIQLR